MANESSLEELKNVLTGVLQEISIRLAKINNKLLNLSIEGIVETEFITRSLIQVKKVLDRFPVNPDTKFAYTCLVGGSNNSLVKLDAEGETKLQNFRISVEYTIQECSMKLQLLATFLEQTDNLKKALTLATSVHQIKKMPDEISNEVTNGIAISSPIKEKKTPRPMKQISKAVSLKNLTMRVQDKSKGPPEPELYKAVVEVVHNLCSRLETLQNTTYSPKIISPNSMEELLIGIRILKDIRQSMIKYGDYVYPATSELQITTEKLNELHIMGQGKLITLYVLANNTLSEILTNLKRYISVLNQNSPQLLHFARVLRSLKRYLDRLKSPLCYDVKIDTSNQFQVDANKKYIQLTPIKRLRKLQRLLKGEISEDMIAQENYFKQMYGELSYQYTKNHLLKLNIQQLDVFVKELVSKQSKPVPNLIQDDVDKFIAENKGKSSESLEQLITLLRSVPRYLTQLAPYLPYAKLDDYVSAINSSIFADLFVNREEVLILNLIKSLIDSTDLRKFKGAGEILRANSVLTKVLSGYMKRSGARNYLHYVLDDPLVNILTIDDPIELDPLLIYRNLYPLNSPIDSRENAMLVPSVQTQLVQNRIRLTKYCKFIFDKITKAIDLMPFGIRWIARQFVVHINKLYTEDQDRQKTLFLGSFLFLHYFTPALISPEAFGVKLSQPLTDNQRRTLLLIAKVLQNMANGRYFSGKENWMEPMNDFIQEMIPQLNRYFTRLLDTLDKPELQLGSMRISSALLCKMKRNVVIPTKILFEIIVLLKEHLSKLVSSNTGDPLSKILLGIKPEDLSNGNPVILLQVLFDAETFQFKTEISNDMKDRRNHLSQVKNKLSKLLVESDSINSSNSNSSDNLIQFIQSLQLNNNNTKDLINDLNQLPVEYQENSIKLLDVMEVDFWKRVKTQEYLLLEKIELLQAIEQQKKEGTSLTEMKMIYLDYIQYIQEHKNRVVPSFQDWLKTKGNERDSLLFSYFNEENE